MARLPRFFVPGMPQHVIQRGNNRQPIFTAERDYPFFLECLREASTRHECDVHAYVLMTNHIHLLATPQHADSLPKMLQSVGRRYVQHFNIAHHRTGTLWEGRYRATLVEAERYLLACYRYIELNPVRAGIVAHPSEYPWSSYHAHARGLSDTLVTEHPLYLGLGRCPEKRQAAYRALFRGRISERSLQAIRDATNKAWALGSDRFKDKLAPLVDRRLTPLPKGRRSGQREGNVESDPN